MKKGESKGVEKLIFSDFYLGTGRMNKKIDFNYSGLTPNTEYTIKVYAIESFGKRSIPLQTEIKTLESSITVDKFTPSVLDVNLSDGTLNDSTYNKTKAQLKGLPNIVFDEQLKKNVLKLDGKSHVNYYVDAEELSATQDHFTLESVFKVNKIQNQTIIENTQGAGLGFEMDANGNVELWAFIGGSYQKVGTKIEKDKYYHLLATFDGDKISIYLDGVLKGEKDVTGSLTNPSSNVPIALGADPDSSGDGTLMLDGNIALARIYSVAMNKDDVLVCLNNYKAMLNAKPIEINCTIKKPDNGLIKLFSDEKFENEITNLSSIKKGDIVYIYAKPNEGYLLKEITVNNEKIETTGYLVNKDCEFSASFEKLPEESYKIIIDETNKEKIEFYSDENFNNKINDITKIKKDSKIYIKTKLDDGYIIDYFIINDMQTTKNYFIINNDTKVDFKEYLKGDANGDNIIDTRDSLTILKHITQLQNIKNENMKSADFNQNGKIDTLDALGILKKLVNIE
ncbi:MAG: LamG-like jellyroll fold domain-containing protein [Oscillospiraceae bacterium]